MMSAIVNHLWQSTLFAAIAALLVLALRNNAARVRYWVWFAASVKFLLPFSVLTWLGGRLSLQTSPGVTDSLTLVQTLQDIAEPAGSLAIATSAPASEGFNIVALVIAIWFLGCVAFVLRWAASWFSISRAVRAATQLEMDVPLAVRSSARLHEPVVVGIARPVMLLPQGITERLTAAQMRAVVAHELCHVRHRDNLTAAIHMLVEVLFWFHPLVWWIGARLIDERERACDEAVLAQGNEPQRYAEGILRVCELYVESRLTCAAGISGADLKHRIEAIMKNRVTQNLNGARRALLSTAVIASVTAPFALGFAAGTSSPTSSTASNTPGNYDTVTITRAAPDSKTSTVAITRTAPDSKTGEQAIMMMMMKGGQFQVRNVSLRKVIAQAYGVQSSLVVGGPAWLDELRYDIDAQSNALSDPTPDRGAHAQMMKAMLAKEFGLIVHTETQQPATLVLGVDRGGAKLRSTDRTTGNMGMKLDRDGVTGMRAPMKVLVDYLAMRLKQPVVDQTGLSGAYDFELKSSFTAEAMPADLKEQLGLTLERQLVPSQVVVVDRVLEPAI